MATTLAQAIAQLENTNPVYNNPGAISGTGDTGTSFGAGIGIYSNLAAGQAALDNQLASIYNGTSAFYTPDMSLDEFGEVYAPNQNYGTSLASILGVPSSTTLSQLNGSSTPSSTVQSNVSKYLSALNPFSTISGHSLEDFVVIGIGILLLAAGVFAFKTSQTIIQVAGKAAKKGAETVAAVSA